MLKGFNLVDLAILALLALSVMLGLYRGACNTGLNLVGLFLSLLIAKWCYPLVTEWIASHEKWMEYLVYFSEGSSHIPTNMMEFARMDVSALNAETIQNVISASSFTVPYDSILLSNITNQVYAGSYTTLYDYFDQTIADFSLNSISFVLTFLFTYAVSSLLIILIDKTFVFPLLKAGDSLVGGAIGAARLYVLMMVLAIMVPLVVNMLQIDLISDLVNNSKFLAKFYPENWFFGWIKSVL